MYVFEKAVSRSDLSDNDYTLYSRQVRPYITPPYTLQR